MPSLPTFHRSLPDAAQALATASDSAEVASAMTRGLGEGYKCNYHLARAWYQREGAASQAAVAAVLIVAGGAYLLGNDDYCDDYPELARGRGS